ncbi:NERD domain-containing protein [Ligilactobacillus acidipiscis]|uniref:NERD domain-containing protein n=1 Tax=Ligilactobacillus acidipiscis TaxID=89059 RepID=UPI0022E5BA8C|nr:NERD domain-containing protein [Ligilactobacillus acidipiscis]
MRKQTFEHQYLQVLAERTQLNANEKHNLQRLVQGYLGECNLDKIVDTFFNQPELVLNDLNLAYNKEVIQVDKLIVIGNIAYLIDVKNYRGSYTYQNNSWYRGERILINNIFRQIDRASDILQKIFSAKGLHMEIRRVLIFMDPAVKVEIKQPIVQTVLRVEEVAAWLMKLKEEVQLYPKLSPDLWRDVITDALLPPYCPLNDFSNQVGRTLQLGICCPKCKKFTWTSHRYYLHCDHCGFCQSKELAYVKTICDYGVLFSNSNLERKELKKFLGEVGNEYYLRYQLKKHFELVGPNGSQKGYRNLGSKFEYWFENEQEYFKALQKRCNWKTNDKK